MPLEVFKEISSILNKKNKEKRLLIIDGTGQGKRLYSIASVYTGNSGTPFFIGIEQIEKRGKELIASQKLIESIMPVIKDYIDLIIGDALYFTETDFNTALKYKKHLFVKTPDTSREIVKETEEEYNMDLPLLESDRKRFTKGYDMERGCSFTVFKKTPYFYKNIPQPLSCYRVEEFYPKTQKKEIFYCITTSPNIGLKEAREIAKKRWQIENNLFRVSNQTSHTKRKRFKDDKTNKNYLTLIFLFISIFWLLYQISITSKLIQPQYSNFKLFCLYLFPNLFFYPDYNNNINTS